MTEGEGQVSGKVTIKVRRGTLVFHEGDMDRANALISEVLATSDPSWPVHASVLNNRGITWSQLGRNNRASADFTSDIDSDVASDEMRAMSLNNERTGTKSPEM